VGVVDATTRVGAVMVVDVGVEVVMDMDRVDVVDAAPDPDVGVADAEAAADVVVVIHVVVVHATEPTQTVLHQEAAVPTTTVVDLTVDLQVDLQVEVAIMAAVVVETITTMTTTKPTKLKIRKLPKPRKQRRKKEVVNALAEITNKREVSCLRTTHSSSLLLT